MGGAVENLSAMPLVFVHDFYFVRRNHIEFQISIGGQIHHPDRFPIPLDGIYKVKRNQSNIQVVLEPIEGWIPNETKIPIRFLYTVAKIFKRWPKTYRWTAELQEDNGNWKMKSDWERLK